jgi:hypothetical protein
MAGKLNSEMDKLKLESISEFWNVLYELAGSATHFRRYLPHKTLRSSTSPTMITAGGAGRAGSRIC